MARKAILIRIDEKLAQALRRWAHAQLRSTNAQIEYVLREAVQRHGGRLPKSSGAERSNA